MQRRRDPSFDPTVPLTMMGAAILFASYWTIFYVTTDDGAWRAAMASLYNTLPAIGLAWIVHLLLDRYVWPAGFAVRLMAQLPLSVLFALAWYLAILVIRGLRGDWLADGFAAQPFVPIAFAWQMFQGVTFYALAAFASLSIVLTRRLRAFEGSEAGPAREAASTLLIRTGEGTETVAIDTIRSISGAGDYAEVCLPGRTVFSTTSLGEFEARLPQDRFFRAHRSHLVAINAIARSEPAGNGRTVLHLTDNRSITTSRAGTRLLRELAA
ncbi:MAG: LytTR family DNA-binding domain-containing protein [Pontixanthobacter sp.]